MSVRLWHSAFPVLLKSDGSATRHLLPLQKRQVSLLIESIQRVGIRDGKRSIAKHFDVPTRRVAGQDLRNP